MINQSIINIDYVCRLAQSNSSKTTLSSSSSSAVNSLKSHFRSSIEKLKKIFKIGAGGGWKRVPIKASTSSSSSINNYIDLNNFSYSDESESLINSHSQSQLPLNSLSVDDDFQNTFNKYVNNRKTDSSSCKTLPVMKRITHQLIDDEVHLIKF